MLNGMLQRKNDAVNPTKYQSFYSAVKRQGLKAQLPA